MEIFLTFIEFTHIHIFGVLLHSSLGESIIKDRGRPISRHGNNNFKQKFLILVAFKNKNKKAHKSSKFHTLHNLFIVRKRQLMKR